jgi:hypothetical protein
MYVLARGGVGMERGFAYGWWSLNGAWELRMAGGVGEA